MKKASTNKQNIQLPKISHRNSIQGDLSVRKQKYFRKPKMTRIMYSSMISSTKQSINKDYLLQAYMDNKNYDDILDDMKEKEIQRGLRGTQTNVISKYDETLRNNLIGKQAKLIFYQNYKNLERILNKKLVVSKDLKNQQADKDPATQMLAKAQKLGILPCSIGLVKYQGDSSILSINGHKYGDKYIQAISAGLKQATMIQKCQLSNNRITDKGFNCLLQSLGHQITKLDLSHNRIVNTSQKLLILLTDHQARLQYLNLQNNLIHDKAAESIFNNASRSRHLKYLNLRKNILTKNCASSLSNLIQETYNLQQLYIGNNRIGQEGAIQIIKTLQDNKSIKVFDYSLNNLGQCKNVCAKNIANLLTKNKTLLHVDFSGNNFTQEDSLVIGEALYGNKKIYGFHFGGNYGYIDSKGFYQPEERDLTSLHTIMTTHIQSYEIIFRRENSNFQPKKFRNVCWICQGWYQQTFKFTIPQPSVDGKNLVYIHFDFQEYQPRLINLTDINVKYKTMVPPRKYKYFFTWNNQQFVQKQKDNQNIKNSTTSEKNSKSIRNKIIDLDLPLLYQYEMYNQMKTIKVQKVITKNGKPTKLVNPWNQLIVEVLPRQVGLVNKKQKKAWQYKDSLWSKQWKLDDQQLTKNCFERDWKCSKLSNLIKNQAEQDKVKQILYKNYKLIKELYRHYSSHSPFNGDIWAVSNNAFTDFGNYSKIISKDTPLKISDLTFITTNSLSGADWKGNSLVPERGLIRFQFMQALVRLAQQKFKKNGLTDSILGSVTMLINDHLLPLATNPICTSQKWRLEKYFIEQNDMLIKKYRSIFTQIYKKNSKMKVKPGNKAFMCLAEFKSIIQKIGISGTYVLQRDLFLSSNCSMMTQIDQIQNQRFMRMTEIQFIEAIARCSYILPNHCKIQDIFDSQTPFHAKFQWIIHQLKGLCSEDLKSQFPSVSIFQKNQDD